MAISKDKGVIFLISLTYFFFLYCQVQHTVAPRSIWTLISRLNCFNITALYK